jgi:hypothetical protein
LCAQNAFGAQFFMAAPSKEPPNAACFSDQVDAAIRTLQAIQELKTAPSAHRAGKDELKVALESLKLEAAKGLNVELQE